jgi:hypothetical protein
MSLQNDRVLSRMGARELTSEEATRVSGSRRVLPTNTVCTFPSPANPKGDGDQSLGECS